MRTLSRFQRYENIFLRVTKEDGRHVHKVERSLSPTVETGPSTQIDIIISPIIIYNTTTTFFLKKISFVKHLHKINLLIFSLVNCLNGLLNFDTTYLS